SPNKMPLPGGEVRVRINGTVLMGGADYQNLTPPAEIDARYLWQADDGEIIIVRNGGTFGSLSPSFEARVDGPYAYLNDGRYLSSNPGVGQGGVALTFYESTDWLIEAPAAVELRHLRYFVAVAEELSFTRAAARLRTAQPSLSQQIRHLENELGVTLLDRNRHRVAVTNAGRVFLQQAKDILARVEHASRLARQAAEGLAGELSVGTFPSADVRILPALRPLIAEHLPELRLILHSKYAVEPLSGLRTGTLDVAFMRPPEDASGLDLIDVLRERIVIVLP